MIGMKNNALCFMQMLMSCAGVWGSISTSVPIIESSQATSTYDASNGSLSTVIGPAGAHVSLSSAIRTTLSTPQALDTLSVLAIEPDPTVTMDVPQSILTSAQNKARMTSVKASGTQAVLSVSVAKGPCTNIKWEKPKNCTSLPCVEDVIASTNTMLSCKNRGQLEMKSVTKQDEMMISDIIQSLGLNAGKMLMLAADSNPNSDSSAFYISDNIEMAAGFLDGQKYNQTNFDESHVILPFKVNITNVVGIHVDDILKASKSVYVWAKFQDLLTHVPSSKLEMDFEFIQNTPVSELRVVEDRLFSVRKSPDMELNSDILSFMIEPRPLKLTHPLIITLEHKMVEEKTVKCVYWNEGQNIWSSEGIITNSTNSTHTICYSHHLGTFAVISKIIKDQPYPIYNKMIITLASVLGSLSTVALVSCIAVIVLVGYYNTDRMKIYINLDVALIVGHLVFFIGLSASEDMALCSNIATVLHFCEVAALSWMFMEAIYIYDSLNHIFNINNINPFFFYLAFGWGLPAAFAGACSGYPFGSAESNEFCWLFVKGRDIWYFAAPTLILVLMNIAIRVMIFLGIDNIYPGDPQREKVIYALQTAAILLPVFILTWVFGVIAVNATTTKAFHYLFIIFHTLQGLLIFVFHCAKNKEIWQFYKAKKEEEERKANAVLQFTYVP